ncbi:MAG: hypothetical protein F4Y47_06020 [Acidobacteriia bacterium]|nr:hypothetical protein [Terriglobia bacterium]MYG01811.1 hypothetical protein [Terriglobia bacterium]MYK08449.1 hypothetical protein [Terriglobia bacterium]
MGDWVAALLAALKGMKVLRAVFREGDIPICKTRVMREGRGLPWGNRILVHPRKDGIEIMSASASSGSTKRLT